MIGTPRMQLTFIKQTEQDGSGAERWHGWVMGKGERSKPSEQLSAAATGLQSCSNMQTLLHKLLY